ncbi:MAG: hypothetical protein ACPG4Z_07440, partial [Chitinophagales bacterium]
MIYRIILLLVVVVLLQPCSLFAQNCIVDTIPTNTYGGFTSAIVDDGDYIWQGNSNYKILKLSKLDGSIISELDIDVARPYGMELIGSYLWVTEGQHFTSNDSIHKIDTLTGITVKKIPAKSATSNETGLAWDGEYLWHCERNTSQLYKIDTLNGDTIDVRILDLNLPTALSFDGDHLWISDNQTHKIYQYDTLARTFIDTIDYISQFPNGMSVDGDFMWAAYNETDSIYKIDLPCEAYCQVFASQSITTCDSAEINANWYFASQTITDTLMSVNNCDSIIITNLTINNAVTSSQNLAVCDSVQINGTWYFASQTVTDIFPNAAANGCDSTMVTELEVYESTSSTEVVSTCDTYTWAVDGMTYTTSGNYTTTIPNAANCDSVITLDLTINESTSSTESVTTCDTYTWAVNGMTYTASGNYTTTITNAANCDSVITLDLTINESTSSTESVTTCDTYTWSVDGMTYTTSGNYTAIIPNAMGCDSVITLDLTINNANANISQAENVLTVTLGSDTYQWLDCDNNYSEIIGETSNQFTATQNGNYAVKVTANGCVDTSACVQVISIGIRENLRSIDAQIAPNPTAGQLYITLQEQLNDVTISIYDI